MLDQAPSIDREGEVTSIGRFASSRLAPRATRRSCVRLLLGLVAAATFFVDSGPASALTNGDFGAGLAGWETAGPVDVSGGALRLRDVGPSDGAAWQVVPVLAPLTRIEFDVLGELSEATPSEPFGFPDVFAASIYLLDELVGFAPGGASLGAVSVLSIDADGPFDAGGRVEPAARGGDWLHVTLDFESPSGFIALAFELFELGFVGGDSEVRIDDVVVTPVPEPTTALLVGLGLAACARARCRPRGARPPR